MLGQSRDTYGAYMVGKRLTAVIVTITCCACAFVWFGLQHIEFPNIEEELYPREELAQDAAIFYKDMALLALRRHDSAAALQHCTHGLKVAPAHQELRALKQKITTDQLSQSVYEN